MILEVRSVQASGRIHQVPSVRPAAPVPVVPPQGWTDPSFFASKRRGRSVAGLSVPWRTVVSCVLL